MSKQPRICCFTDVLCGYSYIAHARFEELATDFAGQVTLTYHFRSTYGDVRGRLAQSGKSPNAYSAMAREVLDRFDHIEVHPDIFRREVPTSSIPAHLYLRAVKLLEDEGLIPTAGTSVFSQMMWAVQRSFFRDLVDVSQRSVLDEIAGDIGIPIADVARVIDDGRAFAELDRDARLERRFGVQMSPALVLNEGRQVLNGNVGYRIIKANIDELLSTPIAAPGWC